MGGEGQALEKHAGVPPKVSRGELTSERERGITDDFLEKGTLVSRKPKKFNKIQRMRSDSRQ